VGKRAFISFIAAVLISAGGLLEAQTASTGAFPLSGWRVFHAEGTITLNRGGARILYQGDSKELAEILLVPGDMIQTSTGKAELQMISGASLGGGTHTVIKLSENASLLIGDKPEDGDFVIELLYGRMRVVTGTAEPSIEILSGSSLAAIKDSDTAIDFVAMPSITHPMLSLHCFSGEGELIPRLTPGAEEAKIPISAGESLVMEYQTPFSYVERTALDDKVAAYWDVNPFAGEAPLAMPLAAAARTPEPAVAEKPAPMEEPVVVRQEDPQPAAKEKTSNEKTPRPPRVSDGSKGKHFFAIAGVLLVVAGAAAQTYSLIGNPSPALKDPLFYGSYASMGVGVVFVIGSAIFYPGKSASKK